jgi:hypothetical protein
MCYSRQNVSLFLEITGYKVGELIVHPFRCQAAFVGLPLEYRAVFLRAPFEIYFYITTSFEKIGWKLSECSA